MARGIVRDAQNGVFVLGWRRNRDREIGASAGVPRLRARQRLAASESTTRIWRRSAGFVAIEIIAEMACARLVRFYRARKKGDRPFKRMFPLFGEHGPGVTG